MKEIARFHRSQQEQEQKQRAESEERRLAEAELAMQQALAAAEEERKRQQLAARKAQLAKRAKPQRARKSKDTFGMNSPKKFRGETKTLRSQSVRPSAESKKAPAPAKQDAAKKCVGFGSVVPLPVAGPN